MLQRNSRMLPDGRGSMGKVCFLRYCQVYLNLGGNNELQILCEISLTSVPSSQVFLGVDSEAIPFAPPPSGFLAPPERRLRDPSGVLPPDHDASDIHTSVALPEDFSEVAALRLDVFTAYPNSLVRRQMEKRALTKMEDRRQKGTTCVVARFGGPRGALIGSLELSWHEFLNCDVDAPISPEDSADVQRSKLNSNDLGVPSFRPHGARLYITEMCVAPFARRRGVALALLRASEDLVCRSNSKLESTSLPATSEAASDSNVRGGKIRRRDKVAKWVKKRMKPRARRETNSSVADTPGIDMKPRSTPSPALYLHVDGSNDGALALYQRAGFRIMFDSIANDDSGSNQVVSVMRSEESSSELASATQRAECLRFAKRLGLLSGDLAKINHVLMVRDIKLESPDLRADVC